MRHLLLGSALLLSSGTIAAQDTAAGSAPEPTDEPILVIGEKAETREVYAGSRVARTPVFKDGVVATTAGTRGLVPQSGMDQGSNRIRKIVRRTCRADTSAIGERAACLLAKSDAARQLGDIGLATSYLRTINREAGFNSSEKVEAAKRLYELGVEAGDVNIRSAALRSIIDTGELSALERRSAYRTLARMSLDANDPHDALVQMQAIDAEGNATSRDLANLAILTRQIGAAGASRIMYRAIAAHEESDGTPPSAWRSFAALVD